MTEQFVDTAYWIALLHKQDNYHELAARLARPERMVTTVAVRLEVMDAFSSPPYRPLAVTFWNLTMQGADIEVLAVTQGLLARAVELFRKRPDKGWSLTDCISFVVMTDRKITLALSTDHHFEQAGFQILMKP